MNSNTFALQTGALVGELEIQQVLGSGASSITYQVSDPALGTFFALKEYFPLDDVTRLDDGHVQVRDEPSGEAFTEGLERFRAEGQMVAAVDHPGIVKVLRYFEANGTAYLLMPWFQGQTLDRMIKSEGNPGQAYLRNLVLKLLDALEYLHQQELFHLDIKPANIFLTDGGDPVLLDFSAAAIGSAGTAFIVPGQGSQGYAAPEQSDTDGEIGPWTDFYGFAATIYRCITGQIPESAELRREAIGSGLPDPLITVSSVVKGSEYGGLIDLVAQGMQLDHGKRPKSAEQWRKSFESLDWRRMVAGKASSEFKAEGREWLPIILLSIFLLSMVAVAVYLVTNRATDAGPELVIADPDSESSAERVRSPPEREQDKPSLQVSAEETRRWQASLQADTVLGYRRFMESFPDSIYREQAQLQLDILDDAAWKQLSAENTRKAFEDYLEQFPAGRHQAESLIRIDEIDKAKAQAERERLEREQQDEAAWSLASNSRTIASMERYISDWPAGIHIDEAQQLQRQLQDLANDSKAFELAHQLGTRESFQAYIDAFPRGTHVTGALEMIDGLTFRPGKHFRDCSACPEMTVVPGGAFWQGSDEGASLATNMEQPRRTVNISGMLAVGTFEVTMDEWDACLQAGVCKYTPTDNGWGRGNRPVIMVSWNDARQYVQWLNQETGKEYRLPSESEWEYFARAGTEGDWLGGDAALLCEYGNVAGTETGFRWQHESCADSQNLGTLPVGSMKANAFGLYDVIGNVAEWTVDCMNLSYIDAPTDGSAWGRGICSSHMTRGGSWVTGSKEVRLPARFSLKSGDRNDFTGFRVVRSVEN